MKNYLLPVSLVVGALGFVYLRSRASAGTSKDGMPDSSYTLFAPKWEALRFGVSVYPESARGAFNPPTTNATMSAASNGKAIAIGERWWEALAASSKINKDRGERDAEILKRTIDSFPEGVKLFIMVGPRDVVGQFIKDVKGVIESA
jgi:hypothetical protein